MSHINVMPSKMYLLLQLNLDETPLFLRRAESEWANGGTLCCGTLDRGFELHQCLQIQVHRSKRPWCYDGHWEANRCHTVDGSDKPIVYRQQRVQVRDPPSFWNTEQTSPEFPNKPHKKDIAMFSEIKKKCCWSGVCINAQTCRTYR